MNLSDKYPSLSAYNYCALNPVMLVDPDGREVEGDPNSNSKIQVVQTFKFDKTPTGNDKKVGTDLLTQTEVSTSVNNGVETRTTVVTSVSVDAEGKPAENATRFAFSESGTGDNRQFAQTPVEEVPLEKVKGPIVDAVKATAKYKAQNGESQLQTKASRLNLSTAIVVGTASNYVPLAKGIYKFIQAVAIGVGTAELQPFNPETLNITY